MELRGGDPRFTNTGDWHVLFVAPDRMEIESNSCVSRVPDVGTTKDCDLDSPTRAWTRPGPGGRMSMEPRNCTRGYMMILETQPKDGESLLRAGKILNSGVGPEVGGRRRKGW